jgi:hypothetical protein
LGDFFWFLVLRDILNLLKLKTCIMKKIISSLFLSSSMMASFAQVPLNSVVESFTNTQCSACASRNPGFHSNVVAHPSITLLTINPSAPYAGCILSKQNKVDNDDRTKFYSIFGGTPRIVVNGDVVSGSTSYSAASVLSPYVGLMSPIELKIMQTNYGSDSIKAKVVIKKVAATASDARLFIGLVEDTIFVNGGNGETKHYNVLRKSLTGATPQSVSLAMMPIGDSVTIEMTGIAAAFWDMNRMFAMTILHENSTIKIVQSAKTSPMKTASIANVTKALDFNYSPNPAMNTLKINTASQEKISYQLYNFVGLSLVQNSFTNSTTINVANLPNGFYVLKLLSETGATAQQKILVQH